MERIQYMVTFARVVQAGSFVGAAEKLNLASSVVSKHISKLEKDMGVRLLNRTTRSLSLTEAGTAFYQHCARIVEEVEQSEQAVASLQARPQGRLRITTTQSILNSMLTPMIPDFMQAYPLIELEVVASDNMVDLVEDGYDLALRITSKPAEHLVARRLSTIRFHVMGSPDYLARYGTPECPEDLKSHVCLNYPAAISRQWVFNHNNQRLEVDINSPIQFNSVDALRQLAVRGVGLALLPVYGAIRELESGELQCLMPDYHGFGEATLFAVHLQHRYGSPKLRAFVDYLAAYIKGLDYEQIHRNPA